MKSNILKLLLASAMLFPNLIAAQNVDEIIAKHIQAHGGAKNWESVKSLKMSGNFTAFSLEKPFTSIKTKDGKYYSDLYLGIHPVKEAYTGDFGWTIDPWMEIDYARTINSDETSVFLQKAELFSPFYRYKEKGNMVEYLGKQKVDGSEMFVLQLTRKDKSVEKWYLNSESYLEYKCESKWVDFAQAVPAEIYFDDFRETEGLILPYFVERIFRTRDRIMQVENIEINPILPKNVFEMPKSNEMTKLSFLQGNWDVKMEFIGRNGNYRDGGKTESVFEFTSTNLLQEKISYDNYLHVNLQLFFSFDTNTKQYKLNYYDDFSSSMDQYLGNYDGEQLVFSDINLNSTRSSGETELNKRFTYSKLDHDHFRLEVELSKDGGNTWTAESRFSYSRK